MVGTNKTNPKNQKKNYFYDFLQSLLFLQRIFIVNIRVDLNHFEELLIYEFCAIFLLILIKQRDFKNLKNPKNFREKKPHRKPAGLCYKKTIRVFANPGLNRFRHDNNIPRVFTDNSSAPDVSSPINLKNKLKIILCFASIKEEKYHNKLQCSKIVRYFASRSYKQQEHYPLSLSHPLVRRTQPITSDPTFINNPFPLASTATR